MRVPSQFANGLRDIIDVAVNHDSHANLHQENFHSIIVECWNRDTLAELFQLRLIFLELYSDLREHVEWVDQVIGDVFWALTLSHLLCRRLLICLRLCRLVICLLLCRILLCLLLSRIVSLLIRCILRLLWIFLRLQVFSASGVSVFVGSDSSTSLVVQSSFHPVLLSVSQGL